MFSSNPRRGQTLSASLCSDPGDVLIRSTRAELRVQNTDPRAAPRPGTAPPPPDDDELQTIRLAAGGRGAGLEALRQRSQSAPCRRQVRVTLLDSHHAPRPSTRDQDHSPQNAPGPDSHSHDAPGPDSHSHDAPGAQQCALLFQIDTNKVTELTESVQRLLQQYRGQSLTEALHRLETLHQQQLILQTQLLDSALKTTTRPQAPPPAHLSTESRAAQTFPVTSATNSFPAESTSRTNQSTEEAATGANQSTEEAATGANQSTEEAVTGANQVLREVGRVRSEMKSLFTREEPGEPSRTEPAQSPSKKNHHRTQQNLTNTHRTQQNLTNTHRTQQNLTNTHRTHPQPGHPVRNQPKTTIPKPSRLKNVKERQTRVTIPEHQENDVEKHESYIQILEERIRSHQEHLKNQQNRSTAPEEEERDEAQTQPQQPQNRTRPRTDETRAKNGEEPREEERDSRKTETLGQNAVSSKRDLSPDCASGSGGIRVRTAQAPGGSSES
ncbi:bromodomain-containing protein DDB_G0280777 isoform X2 [Boleophthalmus pectinirostris]|uniref:bromodomain-containing protein DDB_G0280777 isoform X2 n=1 Tax=Boleophthalmus pectinirostris TaxID=150288 RepID=UPI0024324BC7|nr:bromodomain-containing protein DDB_G0280777 isoform X2 [Boleophthalmus pectinirostris]